MKKTAITILLLGLLLLTGCKDSVSGNDTNTNRFVKTQDYYWLGMDCYDVYYDSVEKIVYLKSGHEFTCLIGEDKKPVTIKEYEDKKGGK